MRTAYIVAAKRTAFGDFGGILKNKTATELGSIASIAAIQQLPPKTPITLMSKLPNTTPAVTVNRLCGSGFESVVQGAREIACGDANVVLVGGTENMSQSPFVVRDGRWGIKLGQEAMLEDSLMVTLTDQYPKPLPMGITAENLAVKYDITRDQCDEYAIISQQRWKKANLNGEFKDEIVPISIKERTGLVQFDTDQSPRPDSTFEAIQKLKPVFKENGVTSAANSSGIADGAAAIVLASKEALKQYQLNPLARIVSSHVVGVAPEIMGIAPVDAMKMALSKAKLKLSDMSRVEVNEAFAAQYLSVEKEMSLDRSITNVNGGAIAMGHPLAASGTRILAHLVYQMKKYGMKYSLGSACIGGGQGIALVLENIE